MNHNANLDLAAEAARLETEIERLTLEAESLRKRASRERLRDTLEAYGYDTSRLMPDGVAWASLHCAQPSRRDQCDVETTWRGYARLALPLDAPVGVMKFGPVLQSGAFRVTHLAIGVLQTGRGPVLTVTLLDNPVALHQYQTVDVSIVLE